VAATTILAVTHWQNKELFGVCIERFDVAASSRKAMDSLTVRPSKIFLARFLDEPKSKLFAVVCAKSPEDFYALILRADDR
jgi:hypothetical protein